MMVLCPRISALNVIKAGGRMASKSLSASSYLGATGLLQFHHTRPAKLFRNSRIHSIDWVGCSTNKLKSPGSKLQRNDKVYCLGSLVIFKSFRYLLSATD